MARQFAIGGKKMLQETLAHNRIRGERRACHKMNTTAKEKMKTKQDSLTHRRRRVVVITFSRGHRRNPEKKQNRKTNDKPKKDEYKKRSAQNQYKGNKE